MGSSPALLTDAGSWWTRGRLSFSLAVFVGYAVTVVFWELWTPWWAGDHIGLSFGAIVFYAVGGLLWIGAANAVYTVGPLGERFLKPQNVDAYRKWMHKALVASGGLSTLLWFAAWMLVAWSRRP